jgi:uncharacterized protein
LAGASSPYLRQHATNPVDWYPWSAEALERARGEDKPLFVSIGYAACHWCHVMAHESFEDSETAAALSRSFVSVKVDREERPDVDAVYMAAVQAMTGSGGWPMSVFCTPDGRPFFAGTYFPPTDRHGLPAFRRIVESIADAWRSRRSEVESQADALAGAVAREALVVDHLAATSPPTGHPSWEGLLERIVGELGERFDPGWGGFGGAPKFPRPTLVELCLRHHRRTGDRRSLTMATTTLDAMAAGGIYDHLEGGFARYSTDQRWLVPHFEKMLTDQALLARAYLHAWQAVGTPAYLQVVNETLDYVCSSLSAPQGGLSASVDADAAGVEGGHATWTPSEVRQALADAGLEGAEKAVCDWYGITEHGNWEGRNVLHRPLGAPLERPPDIEAARRALLAARRRRPQPARDDKVLTEWNAMFIATLAEAAAVCGSDRWRASALSLAEHLFRRNRRADLRWLRSPAGEDGAAVTAFAADHAWVAECCTRLAELTGEATWIRRAEAVATALLGRFWDDEHGGLFTTADDAERLIVRAKDVVDGAVPSANSAAAVALLRLAALTGGEQWRRAGERIVELATPLLDTQALAVADLGPAVAFLHNGSEVVVAGDRPDLLGAVRRHWLPDSVLAWGDRTTSPIWEGRTDGAAYVCRNFVCQRPAGDVESLEAQLVPLAAERPR